jgi:hypothetical protein
VSAQEIAAQLLAAQACPACRAPAPGGEPCPECGAIPAVTGPELTAELEASPLAVAEIEAGQAFGRGYALIDQAIEAIHEGNRIRVVARLRLERDQAQERLAAHQNKRLGLFSRLRAARKPAATAADDLAKAEAEHAEIARLLEIARRYKAGVKAQADAAVMLDKAITELAAYRTANHSASAALHAAEETVRQHDAELGRLEQARDAAAARFADPGPVGYGPEAISAGLLRLILAGKLDAAAFGAGAFGSWVCMATGSITGIEDQARAALLAEQESAAAGKPLMRGHTADGQPVAPPNPHYSGTPQPYHPPAAGSQPHPVTPATTPAWPL